MNKKVLIALILLLLGLFPYQIAEHIILSSTGQNWGAALLYFDLFYLLVYLILLLSFAIAIRGYLEIRRTREKGKLLSLIIIALGAFKLIMFLLDLLGILKIPAWL